MSKVLNDLNLLQDKLENLIERYDFLVEENEVLSSNLNNLHHKYQRKCNELEFEGNIKLKTDELLLAVLMIRSSKAQNKYTK